VLNAGDVSRKIPFFLQSCAYAWGVKTILVDRNNNEEYE